MPELPEVETVKNELAPHLIGRRITHITLLWAGIVRDIDGERQFPSLFSPYGRPHFNETRGRRILDVYRRGKYLILCLDATGPTCRPVGIKSLVMATWADSLVIHLKMTGSLILGRENEPPPYYTRAILHLDNGTCIFFRDPRKFGMMQLINEAELRESILYKLGPEPLDDDFTLAVFADRLENHRMPIKALLLDQQFLAGVGNMYADEALFKARIHPRRDSSSLTPEEIVELYDAIREVLMAGIAAGGASIVTYYRPDGSKGTAHQQFNVAHGQRKNCTACGTPIKRIVVRGRGTYYCPQCQPEKS